MKEIEDIKNLNKNAQQECHNPETGDGGEGIEGTGALNLKLGNKVTVLGLGLGLELRLGFFAFSG